MDKGGRYAPLTGCDLALNSATNLYTVDCSSKHPYNSPRRSMALDARQSVPIGDFTLTAPADTHYRSVRTSGSLPEQQVGAS